jgi:hypothetical protein
MIADGTAAAHGRTARFVLAPLLLVLALLVAACSSAASTSPSASPGPGASGASSSITTADEAAAAVAAANPRLAGIEQKNPDMIGQGSFWVAEPIIGGYTGGSPGSWRVTYTIGWGDCPSGCIYQHVWTYEVAADGTVTLKSQTGDPLASDAAS